MNEKSILNLLNIQRFGFSYTIFIYKGTKIQTFKRNDTFTNLEIRVKSKLSNRGNLQGNLRLRELTINCLFSLYFAPPLVRILPHAPQWAGGLTHQLPGLEITDFSAWLGLNIETKRKQDLSVSLEKRGGETKWGTTRTKGE